MTSAIDDLLLAKDVSITKSERLFRCLFAQTKNNPEIAETVLLLLRKKGESPNELGGFIRAVRKLEKTIPQTRFPDLVDGCGTGGDGANTFNISTIASFVAAGAGAHVAKHGNRSISSQCGSADLLEALGMKIDASRNRMLKALKEARIGYFHAPLYHPAFRAFQPLRQKLAQRYKTGTIFNIAGPFLNPLRPARQAIGVFNQDLTGVVAETAKKLKMKRVLVFRNSDGIDELTTTNRSILVEVNKKTLRTKIIAPAQFGFKKGKQSELKGGKRKLNRKIALNILTNQETNATRKNTVLLNAAAILYASGRAKTLNHGIELAKNSIKSGAAYEALKKLIRISHDA